MHSDRAKRCGAVITMVPLVEIPVEEGKMKQSVNKINDVQKDFNRLMTLDSSTSGWLQFALKHKVHITTSSKHFTYDSNMRLRPEEERMPRLTKQSTSNHTRVYRSKPEYTDHRCKRMPTSFQTSSC